MKKLFLLALMAITTASSFALTIEEGKTYTIQNNKITAEYVQGAADGETIKTGALNENSYWEFEATANANCFYVKNAITGLYAQAVGADNDQDVTMGTSPVEYKVLEMAEGVFGLTSTQGRDNTSFTGGCKGWNENENEHKVISFDAVYPGNAKSFWKITEAQIPETPDYWPLDGKVYRISNKNFKDESYMKDNGWDNDFIACDATSNAYSYWKFTKTANEYCYNIQNTATGRYIQGYANQDETDVTLGATPAEFIVKSFSSEENCYGIAFTGNDPHDFTSIATKGLNLRKDPNEDGCCVQAFKAHEGENHRSFWKLQQANTTSINVSAAGYATFVAPFDVTIPAEVEAYALTSIEDGYVRLAQVTEVPACNAVLVKATEGNHQAEMIASATAIGTNELKATRSALTPDVEDTYFVLSNGSHGIGFYAVEAGTTVAAGKGYFEVATPGAKFIGLSDDTTAVEGIIVEKLDGTNELYNLQGQKLQNLQKGINIINGRKVLVK